MASSSTLARSTSSSSTVSRPQPGKGHEFAAQGNEVISDLDDAHQGSTVPKTTKRKHDDADSSSLQTTLAMGHPECRDYSVLPRSRKKAKQQASAAKDDDTVNIHEDGEFGEECEPATAQTSIKETRKVKAHPKAPDAIVPDYLIQQFLDGITALDDDAWTSASISDDICQLIKWIDKDDINAWECAKRWNALGNGKQGVEVKNQAANIYKHRTQHGPNFYKEKGLTFVPLKQKNAYLARIKKAAAGRAKKTNTPGHRTTQVLNTGVVAIAKGSPAETFGRFDVPPSKPEPPQRAGEDESKRNTLAQPKVDAAVEESRTSTLDSDLHDLFVQELDNPLTIKFSSGKVERQPTLANDLVANNGVSNEDIARFYANRNSLELLSFKRKSADLPLGDPARPILDRQAAAQYSVFLQEQLSHEPDIELIEYADSVRPITIFRFISCVSPTLRSGLPTHDLVEADDDGKRSLLQTPIAWSMIEFQELYLFALQMKCEDVCDMVLDRLHEDFRCPVPRTVVDVELNEATKFNILDISPEFLNVLAASDPRGLDFFTSLLVLKKEEGWNVLDSLGLENWSEAIKLKLMEKLTLPSLVVIETEDTNEFCHRFHHHGDRECYGAQRHTARQNAPHEAIGPSTGVSKQISQWAKPNVKLHQQGLCEGQEYSKKRKRSDRSLNKIEQEREAEDERAEKRRKHKRHLEDLADREAVCKSVTLDALPNLAFPLIFREAHHEQEKPKEKVIPFFYPEELGNGVSDHETATKKMALIAAKLQEYCDFHKVKTLEELEKKLGLGKGEKHVPRAQEGEEDDDTNDEAG